MKKHCTKCTLLLPISSFYLHINKGKKRYRSFCKKCLKLSNYEYRKKSNKSKERIKIYEKTYRKTKSFKKYRSNYRKNYEKQKIGDIQYKLNRILRSRFSNSFLKNAKSGSAVKDLGCSIEELKIYLEKQFLGGMNWDNHTRNGWHIDHIIPISKFDLSKREEFLKACNYSNLQPLWSEDNLKKSNKK